MPDEYIYLPHIFGDGIQVPKVCSDAIFEQKKFLKIFEIFTPESWLTEFVDREEGRRKEEGTKEEGRRMEGECKERLINILVNRKTLPGPCQTKPDQT